LKKSTAVSSILLSFILLFTLGTFVFANQNSNSTQKTPNHIFSQDAEDEYIYLPITIKSSQPQYKIVFSSDYDIYIMNTDGTGLKNLTNTPNAPETSPVWSPDGSMIAYISAENYVDPGDVFIMDADGSNPRNVSNSVTGDEIEPAWAPNSQQIAFASDRADAFQVYDIYVANNDGSGLANVTNSLHISERFPHWSTDSSQLVFTSEMGSNSSIVRVDKNGTNKTAVYSDGDGRNYWPQWIPNNSKISFVRQPTIPGCLTTINPDGTDSSCITNFPGLHSARTNRWNTTGTKSLIQGYDPSDGYWNYLYTFDTNTQQLQKLMLVTPFSAFAWAPDSSQIVYVAPGNSNDDIFIANSDGSNATNLTETLGNRERDPDWSLVPIP